jgi:hypothetical protein
LDSNSLPQAIAIGTRLFYTSSTLHSGPGMSNLFRIDASAPTTTTMVDTTDAVAELKVELLAQDEGLIFLGMDEADNARSLNTDADSTDTAVLALLNGTLSNGVIRNVERALSDDSGPFRARKTASNDWQVGFLVSEAQQGNTNLNAPGSFAPNWQPVQCVSHADTDTSDAVLHYLRFADWNTNPVMDPVRNTGLVGHDRIAIANNFIATISKESDEGGCDLNQDGDAFDEVVRWTQIVPDNDPILPITLATNIRALFDCPGGTHGLAELDGRLVISVSESDDDTDIDGDGDTDKNLICCRPTVRRLGTSRTEPATTPSRVLHGWRRTVSAPACAWPIRRVSTTSRSTPATPTPRTAFPPSRTWPMRRPWSSRAWRLQCAPTMPASVWARTLGSIASARPPTTAIGTGTVTRRITFCSPPASPTASPAI